MFGFAANAIAGLEKLALYMTNILPRSTEAFQAKLDEIEARRAGNAGTEGIEKERADIAANQGAASNELNKDIEAKRAARTKDAEEAQAAIAAERDGQLKANEEIATAKRKQQEEALSRAQEEFDAATKEAELLNTPFVGPKQNALAGATNELAGAGAGGSSFSLGSFSARNAGQQSIGGFGDLKKPLEDTAENTGELVAQGREKHGAEFI